MGKVQQRVLIAATLVATAATANGRKFYDDDPLWQMPKPMRVEQANNRKLSDVYDFFSMTFAKPGEAGAWTSHPGRRREHAGWGSGQ